MTPCTSPEVVRGTFTIVAWEEAPVPPVPAFVPGTEARPTGVPFWDVEPGGVATTVFWSGNPHQPNGIGESVLVWTGDRATLVADNRTPLPGTPAAGFDIGIPDLEDGAVAFYAGSRNDWNGTFFWRDGVVRQIAGPAARVRGMGTPAHDGRFVAFEGAEGPPDVQRLWFWSEETGLRPAFEGELAEATSPAMQGGRLWAWAGERLVTRTLPEGPAEVYPLPPGVRGGPLAPDGAQVAFTAPDGVWIAGPCRLEHVLGAGDPGVDPALVEVHVADEDALSGERVRVGARTADGRSVIVVLERRRRPAAPRPGG